nr:class I SAM-dependent methyltransferase [Cohnella lupini]
MRRRHRDESPNTLIEKPVILELLGDVSDKAILDLGCGDGSLGIELINHGIKSYHGVEGSKNMYLKALENLISPEAKMELTTMEDYSYPQENFDIVVSQLAIHYIEDFNKLAHNIFQTLKLNGKLVFSVQHPLLTSSFESMTSSGRRYNWIVDDYFHSGKRTEPWIGEQVVKFHRTIENYFLTLQNAGFVINSLREPMPDKQYFSDNEEYLRRMRIPLFLLFSCSKS